MKRFISIKAWRGNSYVPAAEILRVIAGFILDSQWALRLDEIAPGPGSDALEAVGRERRITTAELVRLLTPDVQVIDGALSGYAPSGQCRVVIVAVDSTSWDIETDVTEIQENLLASFSDIIL